MNTIGRTMLCSVLVLTCSGACTAAVLSEHFSAFVGDIDTHVTSHLNSYTQMPGWSGQKMFPSNQTAKLGSGSTKAIITTPVLDLATGGALASKLRIQAFTAAKERLLLDNLEVTQDASADDPNILMPASLSFGLIAPSTAATQALAINNSGALTNLLIYALSPASSASSVFAVPELPSLIPPATLLQLIASIITNYTAAQNKELIVTLIPDFVAGTTNCLFRLITADCVDNPPTTVVGTAPLPVVPEPTDGVIVSFAAPSCPRRAPRQGGRS